MGNCFTKKQQVQFIPEKWEQNLGEKCFSCHQILVTDECISLCQCYYFCHERCFLKEFAQFITDRQVITCIRCEKEIVLDIKYSYKWECNKTPQAIISFICGMIALIAMIVLTALGIFKPIMSEGASWAINGVAIFLFILAIILSLRKRYIQVQNVHVKSTHIALTHGNQSTKNFDKITAENQTQKMYSEAYDKDKFDII